MVARPTPLTAGGARLSLESHPELFLQRFPVRVFDSETVSTTLPVMLTPRTPDDGLPPESACRAAPPQPSAFEICLQRQSRPGRRPPREQRTPRAHCFRAHYVHVQDARVGVAPDLYLLTSGQPVVMVTPLLAGCSFVIVPSSGTDTAVAHVRPSSIGRGAATARDLVDALPAQAVVYGPGQHYDETRHRVTLVGILKNERDWCFYAQHLDIDRERIACVRRVTPID